MAMSHCLWLQSYCEVETRFIDFPEEVDREYFASQIRNLKGQIRVVLPAFGGTALPGRRMQSKDKLYRGNDPEEVGYETEPGGIFPYTSNR